MKTLVIAVAAVVMAGGSLKGAEDDAVKGLWLMAPAFPAEAADMGFEQNGAGVAAYTRIIPENGAVFVIERMENQDGSGNPVTEESLPAMIAGFESIDPGSITIEPESDVADLLSYPAAMALYETGESEDTRIIRDLYVFTDQWLFRVKAVFPADWAEEYLEGPNGGQYRKWLRSLAFRE
jgi:hypothetical protein